MIIYFSGTGNSKYCAERLGELLEDRVVDSGRYIRERKKGKFCSTKPYVFCAPVYASYIPLIFERFLRSSEFEGSKEFYFVITLAGNSERGGSILPDTLPDLCRDLGKEYMHTAHITMPCNFVTYMNIPSGSEVGKTIEEAEKMLPECAEIIKAHGKFKEWTVKKSEYYAVKPFLRFYYKLLMKDKKFFADERCVGCGACERVCPMKNITIENGRPVWHGHCTQCTACINRCPKEAIQFGKKTKDRERYYIEKYLK